MNQKEEAFYLTDLANEIQYVPLETNDSCLLFGVYRLLLTSEYILVSDGVKLLQFDLSGKFIRQIGRRGQGPGEHGSRIKMDSQNDEIFIFSPRIMNIYDLQTGVFKRSFKVDHDISDFNVTPGGRILFFTTDLPSGPLSFSLNEVYVTDNNGIIIDSIANHARLNNRTESLGYVNSYRINGEFNYIYNYRDTIYALSEDFIRRPYVVLKLDNSITRDRMVIEITNEVQMPDFIWVQKLTESYEHVFLSIQKGISSGGPDIYNILYDKISGNLIHTSGIKNDIDNGLTFWPQFSLENILISALKPYEIMEYYNSTVGTTKHSESLTNLVKNLDESDNPVLMLVKLDE